MAAVSQYDGLAGWAGCLSCWYAGASLGIGQLWGGLHCSCVTSVPEQRPEHRQEVSRRGNIKESQININIQVQHLNNENVTLKQEILPKKSQTTLTRTKTNRVNTIPRNPITPPTPTPKLPTWNPTHLSPSPSQVPVATQPNARWWDCHPAEVSRQSGVVCWWGGAD
jgi:hypothetical protein